MPKKKNRFNDYKIALYDVERPEVRRKAVLLDTPYIEDVFTRDLTNPESESEKIGWDPQWSRYTNYAKLNETRPARMARETDEDTAEEDGDYRDPTAFRGIYK